ncbi:hypothetical protein HDU93_005341 [Gonapodya sp. JEL0774]|nr:hypothetical protein HDU93_005341 [Gonapodya sp. JEL0774]
MTLAQGPHHLLTSGRRGDQVVLWDFSNAVQRDGTCTVLSVPDMLKQHALDGGREIEGRFEELRFAELCGVGREIAVGAVRVSRIPHLQEGGTAFADDVEQTLLCVWDFGAPNIEGQMAASRIAAATCDQNRKGKGKARADCFETNHRRTWRTRMWERVKLEPELDSEMADGVARRTGIEVWLGWEVIVIIGE